MKIEWVWSISWNWINIIKGTKYEQLKMLETHYWPKDNAYFSSISLENIERKYTNDTGVLCSCYGVFYFNNKITCYFIIKRRPCETIAHLSISLNSNNNSCFKIHLYFITSQRSDNAKLKHQK